MELHVVAQKLFGFNLHKHAHRHLRDHFIPHVGNNHRPHILGHKALGLYSAFLILLKVAVIASPLLFAHPAASLAITPENIIALTNESRADFGVAALNQNAQLMVAAANKARHMMDNGYFAHYSSDGVSPWYWILDAGYNYSYAGENLAIRFTTAEGVTDAWLASPAHKANLLSENFTEIGVAVITDNFGDQGIATLVVQEFGKPQAKQPAKTVEINPTPAQPAKTVEINPTPAVQTQSGLAAPQITFPLNNSYVNKEEFVVLGKAPNADKVAVFLNENLSGTTDSPDGNFRVTIDASDISDGEYTLIARVQDSNGKYSSPSQSIVFKLDTEAPAIDPDKFSITPALGKSDTFAISASTAVDAIRTITIIGKDSSVLTQSQLGNWQGNITLFNAQERQTLSVELYAQDFAGNENRMRVGEMYDGEAAGVFSYTKSTADTPQSFSLFGLFEIPNIENSAYILALIFVAILGLALILKIMIKRHIQHTGTIVGAAGVMMLALILFVL